MAVMEDFCGYNVIAPSPLTRFLRFLPNELCDDRLSTDDQLIGFSSSPKPESVSDKLVAGYGVARPLQSRSGWSGCENVSVNARSGVVAGGVRLYGCK